MAKFRKTRHGRKRSITRSRRRGRKRSITRSRRRGRKRSITRSRRRGRKRSVTRRNKRGGSWSSTTREEREEMNYKRIIQMIYNHGSPLLSADGNLTKAGRDHFNTFFRIKTEQGNIFKGLSGVEWTNKDAEDFFGAFAPSIILFLKDKDADRPKYLKYEQAVEASVDSEGNFVPSAASTADESIFHEMDYPKFIELLEMAKPRIALDRQHAIVIAFMFATGKAEWIIHKADRDVSPEQDSIDDW
jgi:hypothetical protein